MHSNHTYNMSLHTYEAFCVDMSVLQVRSSEHESETLRLLNRCGETFFNMSDDRALSQT